VGQYATSNVTHANRLIINGCALTINSSTPTAHIKAKNLRSSVIGPVSLSGLSSTGIELEDSNCVNNTFINCQYADGTVATINDATAGASNVVIGNGKIKYLAGSTSGADISLYHSTVAERLRLDGGLMIVPSATGNTAMNINVSGEAASRISVSGSGTISLGNGTDAVDTTLYRAAADHLRTGDMFTATDGLVTKVIADVPEDADFTAAPASGLIAIDSANNRIYVRVGATWKYAALT
jgi:hypothetical protein